VVVVISGGNIDFEFLTAEIRACGDRN
jgi:hypothetical protein